ncbi:MAG: serine hydrolase domain-containing protein [Acidobacteriota bacterium]
MRQFWVCVGLVLAACGGVVEERNPAPEVLSFDEEYLTGLLEEHATATLGLGVLRGGELVWSGYFGEQAPGVPASRQSMFNTASVSKAVTAETVLALVAAGEIDLDEALAPTWVDPDVADDPRHRTLTPRLVLTHRTGFPNWRYQAEDGKLAFDQDPGSVFGYSGEGFQYLRRFVEAKLGRPFEEQVREHVFEPLGMTASLVVARPELEDRLVVPRPADGSVVEPNVQAPGAANAADDFFTTIEDYAKLLATLVEPATGLERDKQSLQSDASGHPHWQCVPTAVWSCPTSHGFGLGWLVFEWPDRKLVWHGGNDAEEHAIGYIDPRTGDGAIAFANGASGMLAMLDALDLIDDRPPIVEFYRALLAAHAG